MTEDQIFVDTNILVYAHDLDAGGKHDMAAKRVSELWNRELLPSLSVQVLQEFYYNLVKKRVPLPTARAAVLDYMEWDVIENDRSLLVEGIAVQERWKSSFWDALILAAARRAKATVLWSEDFNAGQDFDGIVVVNPLQGN